MAFNQFLDSDLFSNLTEDERLKVSRFSVKNEADLPKFFNAGKQTTGQEPAEPISREFEAFLILQALQSPEKLSNALKWFTEAATLQIKRKDRDELLEEAFNFERSDALDILQEIQTSTLGFSQFRTAFESVDVEESTNSLDFSPSRFTAVPELSLLLRDSQLAMGEITSKLTRAEHLVVVNAVLDEQRKVREAFQETVGSIADELIVQELLSWREVITEVQARVSGGSNG